MIAVVVHEMVAVTSKLISYLVYYPSHIFFCELGVANVNRLSKMSERIIRSNVKLVFFAMHTWSETVHPIHRVVAEKSRKFRKTQKGDLKFKFSWKINFRNSQFLQTSISELRVKDLNSRMINSDAQVCSVVVQPVLEFHKTHK